MHQLLSCRDCGTLRPHPKALELFVRRSHLCRVYVTERTRLFYLGEIVGLPVHTQTRLICFALLRAGSRLPPPGVLFCVEGGPDESDAVSC